MYSPEEKAKVEVHPDQLTLWVETTAVEPPVQNRFWPMEIPANGSEPSSGYNRPTPGDSS